VSLHSALAWLLAGVLLASVLAKLAGPVRSASALATFGVHPPRVQAVVLAVLLAVELGLAGAVAAGSGLAAYAAAGVMCGFALATAAAIRRGRAGAPCACFGARSRVSRRAVARDLALAAAFAGLPWAPAAPAISDTGWLAAGLLVALAGVLALGVATLALARELGQLRLRLGPQLALELADEGPPLGRALPLIGRFELDGDAKLALAVFFSESCPLCRALEPALQWLASDPFVAMLAFDEHAEADVWRSLGIPGSPYALVLDRVGSVLAKGAFNSGGQLEGMLATAERRAAVSHAEG
jgi:thiol-disulfide isomerase/thioredoxin